MTKELDNILAVLENNVSVSKSLDVLIDSNFFTYAYMLTSKEVLSEGYITDNKSEVLKGMHLLMLAISNINNLVVNKVED